MVHRDCRVLTDDLDQVIPARFQNNLIAKIDALKYSKKVMKVIWALIEDLQEEVYFGVGLEDHGLANYFSSSFFYISTRKIINFQ